MMQQASGQLCSVLTGLAVDARRHRSRPSSFL